MLFQDTRLLALASVLLVQLVAAAGSAGSSQLISSNDAVATLMRTCGAKSLLTNTCDACSLCQNGAFCRQPSSSSSSSGKHNNRTLSSSSVEWVRSLVAALTCYCVPGYTGTYCQIDIDECLSQPCAARNATCVDGLNAYECRCPAGYAGEHCQIDIDECASSPCMHAGSECVDRVDGFYCRCAPGYTGPTCETELDECLSQPCRNGAKCLDLINEYDYESVFLLLLLLL